MKILTILGARPQFIKAGSLSREIAKYPMLKEVIIHTGQHYDVNMSDIFFDEMQIPKPNYHLNINGLNHGAMTGQMMEKIEEVVIKEKPNWIIIYSDTNSTLAGAIVASKLHIKLVHIEAGLRSFNMQMPEEVNRILTDRVSNILFCPTDTAIKNLQNEGYENLAQKPHFKIEEDYILCTIHRAGNTDNEKRLRDIFEAINSIGKEKQVILPLHPRTKNHKFNQDFKRDFYSSGEASKNIVSELIDNV